MKKIKALGPIVMLMSLGLLSLAGCSSTSEDEFRYYLIDAKATRTEVQSDITIQIKDLSVPKYLERFQIVRRSGDNILSYSDLHQWGEHLQKNLLRTLAMNLTAELGSSDIGTPENRLSLKPKYQLRVLIERFEQSQQGDIELLARYQITQSGLESAFKTQLFHEKINQGASNNYGQMVATMSELFHRLSLDIAQDLQAYEKAPLGADSP